MKLINYLELTDRLPKSGRHINAQSTDHEIIVYQAYRPAIAEYAVREQHFGGEYSFQRMSWIKTSFLWMMYRSGWATKEGQERILRITIPSPFFDHILEQTVISSYSTEYFPDQQQWKFALEKSESRLQWDPDHEVNGNPMGRKAIQLGLKGNLLKRFSDSITAIDDITEFVASQRSKRPEELQVPHETIYLPQSQLAINNIKLDNL